MTPISSFTFIEAASTESFNCVALTRDGTLMAAGGAGKKVCLWDFTNKSSVRQLDAFPGHSEAILNLKFDPTGRYLASTGMDKHVGLLNLRDRSVQLYKAHNDKVHSVAFSPDGSLLASGGADGIARVTKVNEFYESHFQFKHKHGLCRQVLFSPTGQSLLMAGGTGYSLVDIATQEFINDFSHELNHYTHSVAFKNDNVFYIANNHPLPTSLGSVLKFTTYSLNVVATVFLKKSPDANKPRNEAKAEFDEELRTLRNLIDHQPDDLPPAKPYYDYYLEGEFSIRDNRARLLAGTFGKFPEAFRSEIILDDNVVIHSYLTPQSQVNGCNLHKIAFWDVRTQRLLHTLESTSHSSISLPLALANGQLACAGGNRITWRAMHQEDRPASPRHSAASAAAIGSEAEFPEISLSDLVIGKKLYTGLSSKVFQGQWKRERVAVKRCGYKNEQEKEFLLSEAKKLHQLRHERIVQFKAVVFYPTQSRMGIVMEFLPRSLHDIHQEGRELAWKDRLQIAKDIVQAVEFLHTRTPPFIHRDIKSLNVLVSEDSRAKLTDFGLSRIVKTMSFSILTSLPATYNWSAPENLGGQYSAASDMWSTAMTLYEIASRQIPYHEVEILDQVFTKIKNIDIPTFPTHTPPAFVNAARSCLVRDPDKRSTATQLLALLEREDVR